MANVLFKRGLQANLPTTGIVDGAFYLTTDTHRLYVGNAVDANTNELVELNKSITVVNSVSDLPDGSAGKKVEVGQFYYIAGTNTHTDTSAGGNNGNILAVVTSITNGVPHWTQVNPDTVDGNDCLRDVTITKGSYDSTNNVIPYTLRFVIKDKENVESNKTFEKVFNIAPTDIISKADIDVSTANGSATNSVVVTTKVKDTSNNNALSTGDSFTIVGGSNVTVAQSNGQITISTGIGSDSVQMHVDGTTTSNQVAASVRVNSADSGDVLKIAGDTSKDIGITWDSTNSIAKIGHSNSATAAATGAAIALDNSSKSFTAVTSTTYDSYGHISAQTSQQITLPSYSIKTVDVDSADKSKLTVSLQDQTNTEFGSVTSGSILYNTITVYDSIGGTASQSTINNQGDIGTFYSKTAIDNMMKGLDALTYKGTVASASDLPAAADGVHIGDTYKVSTANSGITVGGASANLGDLLIATGTEDSDGNITSATLTWTLVQGNSEADTTYDMKVAAGSTNEAKVGIIASTDSGTFDKYATISGDGIITVTPTAGTGDDGVVALAHATSGATAGTYGSNTTGTVTAGGSIVIPAVTVNSTGHVTSISSATMTLPGANKIAISANDKQVKLQDAASTDLGVIEFANGDLTTASVQAGGAGVDGVVTFNHAVPTMGTDTTPTQGLDISSDTEANRQISVISGVTRDSYGHVTAIATKTITFDRSVYGLNQTTSSLTNGVSVATNLKNAGNDTVGSSTFALQSSGSSITVSPTSSGNATTVDIDIVWGTF